MLKQQYDDWWDSTEPYLVNEVSRELLQESITSSNSTTNNLLKVVFLIGSLPPKENKNKQADWNGYRESTSKSILDRLGW